MVRPGNPRFEQSAKDWLFDLAPTRWRHEQIFHRNPLELARALRLFLDADVLAMQAGLSALSSSPAGARHHRDDDTAIGVCIREQSWAAAVREQVRLVQEALLAVRTGGRPRRSGQEARQQ
ncbi:hypothetical protein [Kitasatospora terrestris]|uniref:Uncharacterized protein n=1 Tax=Kitasatospora terrestris TaxID=258051 RepID=A0ABP9EMF9_9ACTN